MKRMTCGVWGCLFALTSLSMASTTGGDISISEKTFKSRAYGMVEQWSYEDIIAEEEGLLYGIGVEFQGKLISLFWLDFRAEVFTGEVDQESHYVYVNPYGRLRKSSYSIDIPTKYNGYKLEASLVMEIPFDDRFYVNAYGGFGRRSWRRFMEGEYPLTSGDIKEDWFVDYIILGTGTGIAIGRTSWLWGRVEVRGPINSEVSTKYQYQDYPFYNSKAEVEMEPSFYVEAGVNVARFSASVFLETLNAEYPAELTATMAGVKLGFTN